MSVFLPCEHWAPSGNPADGKGYKYSDGKQMAGPCKTVVVKNSRPISVKDGRITATCTGTSPSFPIDYDLTTGEGNVGIVFHSGSDPGYCAQFGPLTGATVKEDSASAFSASKAQTAALCPAS
jgi:hypothetical protein